MDECKPLVLGLAYKLKPAEARSAYEARAPGALLEDGGEDPVPTTIRRTPQIGGKMIRGRGPILT